MYVIKESGLKRVVENPLVMPVRMMENACEIKSDGLRYKSTFVNFESTKLNLVNK